MIVPARTIRRTTPDGHVTLRLDIPVGYVCKVDLSTRRLRSVMSTDNEVRVKEVIDVVGEGWICTELLAIGEGSG